MNAPVGSIRRSSVVAVQRPDARSLRARFGVLGFVTGVAAILLVAWLCRNSGLLTPKSGLGYWLGIAGSLMMALVMLYPLRKRVKFMRGWSVLPTWFRWHMVFGILGPVLVVIHSDFGARSTNAFVALVSMLVVAASGVVGRYLYVHVHKGLYGAKLEARELLGEAAAVRELISSQLVESAGWASRLKEFEAVAMNHAPTLWGTIGQNLALGRLDRKTRKAIVGEFKLHFDRDSARLNLSQAEKSRRYNAGRDGIERYFAAVRKAGALAIYDRLLALWHVLHLPLIVILVITALIHIAVVNLY